MPFFWREQYNAYISFMSRAPKQLHGHRIRNARSRARIQIPGRRWWAPSRANPIDLYDSHKNDFRTTGTRQRACKRSVRASAVCACDQRERAMRVSCACVQWVLAAGACSTCGRLTCVQACKLCVQAVYAGDRCECTVRVSCACERRVLAAGACSLCEQCMHEACLSGVLTVECVLEAGACSASEWYVWAVRASGEC